MPLFWQVKDGVSLAVSNMSFTFDCAIYYITVAAIVCRFFEFFHVLEISIHYHYS